MTDALTIRLTMAGTADLIALLAREINPEGIRLTVEVGGDIAMIGTTTTSEHVFGRDVTVTV